MGNMNTDEQKRLFKDWLQNSRKISQSTLIAYTEDILFKLKEIITLSNNEKVKSLNPNMYAYQTKTEFDYFVNIIKSDPNFNIINKTGQAQSGWVSSPLNHYGKFLSNTTSEKSFIDKVMKKYIELYKNDLKERFVGEKYKWQAVKYFHENWNIKASNFAQMFENATKYTDNLLNQGGQKRPIQMILDYCNENWENEIRCAFEELYTENVDIESRINNFLNKIENVNSNRNKLHNNATWKSYHDLNIVSVYLWLMFPEKYFMYKPTVVENITQKLNFEFKPKHKRDYDSNIFKYSNTQKLYMKIKKYIIDDLELLNMEKEYIDESCYSDAEHNILVQDVAYFIYDKINTEEVSAMSSEIKNLNTIPLNQILYGPPGTGKTYKLENIIKDYIYPQIADEHESTNIYDDILLNNDLNWVEKIIFAFKINNSQNKPLTDVQISKLPLIQRWFSISSNYKDERSLICSIRGEIQKNAIRKEGIYARHENDYFERQENGFILIDDGEKIYNELCEHYDININSFDNNIQTDKSILAKDYYVFCTFHQSYSYEEFVEGIRPIINKSKQDETFKDKNSSTMQFDFHCGIFKDMCIKAKKEPNKKFFIFIDEINRGNISKIFGELITLIEKDKREKVVEDGREYHTIEVTLPYTNDRFTVPNNLYIVGTMNTADKSLALLDVALRRRFEFVPMYPKYDLKDLKHKEFLEALNDRIYFEKKSADFLIGHTYFLGSEAEDLSEVMNKKVTPLLMEYFNAKKEMVEDIVGSLLEKEGYCIDKNEKYLLKVVRK